MSRQPFPRRAGAVLLAALAASFAPVSFGPASAQTEAEQARCDTLLEVLALSVANSPEVNAARARRERSEADLLSARSVRRPQVSTFARTQAGDNGLTGDNFDNTVGLRVSQRVFDFGTSALDIAAARSDVEARVAAISSARNQAALETARSYVRLQATRERLAITAERVEYFERQLRALRTALDLGGATRADVAEIAARLEEARADRLELEFQRERFLTQLSSDTGRIVEVCDGEGGTLPRLQGQTVDLVNRALRRNGEVGALEADIRAQESRVEFERRNRLPAIDVVGIASYARAGGGGFGDNWEYRDRVGVELNVPILSGRRLQADRRRESATLGLRRSELVGLRRDLSEDIEVARRRALSLEAQLLRRRDVVRRQQEQFAAAQAEFEAGLRVLPELVEDRLDLERARLDVVDVRETLGEERAALTALVGGLDAVAVRPPSSGAVPSTTPVLITVPVPVPSQPDTP